MLRLIVASLVMACVSAPALAAESVEDMLLRRIAWITEHHPPLPAVESVPAEVLLGLTGFSPGRDVRAVYDHSVNTIWLRDDFDPMSLSSAYIIVHELVHYLQDLRTPISEASCLGALEPEAYGAQFQWQEEFGPWPSDTNWLFVMLISDCREASDWRQ